ncbi:uncharacterized protein LOC143018133 isoform X2 [Oratosquilla oratoria]|uniref:uncharacterized protein LOC143018133 isoform X2 n=1 Tax=Oratosquilla oratoria TaxID=337810 RepID=UPI003F758229
MDVSHPLLSVFKIKHPRLHLSYKYSYRKAVRCLYGTFQCPHSDQCLPQTEACNGFEQCPDGTDEAYCLYCVLGAFHCPENKCIHVGRLCNGINDCAGGEDEANC